jgi:arylsulfatase A-like enzyme
LEFPAGILLFFSESPMHLALSHVTSSLHRCALVALVVALVPCVTNGAEATQAAADAPRPNIVLVLADDLGFSDLGCYGGMIDTPNLDRLAAGGLRFTQFYNTARCWPTRGAILTGYYAQQIRRDAGPGVDGGGGAARPSWGRLVPTYLRALGYRNYHSGKWHIDGQPLANGFDHSYVLNDHNRFFNPQNHEEDGKPLPPVPPGTDFYVTTHIADHAIKCLKQHAVDHTEKPFFQFVAFTSPHFPLHAPQKEIDKYRGRFAAGWDELRARRLASLREKGIVSCELSDRMPNVPAWKELTDQQRADNEMRMMIHAAMIDRMDQEVGRIVEQLKAMDAFENTVILFASDNGASHESLVRGDGHDPTASPGSARTFWCLEPGGSNVSNAPLRRSKMFVHEGGIATPLIVHWPKGIAARGELRHNPGHVIDLPPTFLDLAGLKWPDVWDEKKVPPIPGRSLVPAFAADDTVRHDYLWWLHQGNRAVRVGDWKLVAEKGQPWELFNLANDRSETRDLAAAEPARVAELSALWERAAKEFGELANSEPTTPGPAGKGKGRKKEPQ